MNCLLVSLLKVVFVCTIYWHSFIIILSLTFWCIHIFSVYLDVFVIYTTLVFLCVFSKSMNMNENKMNTFRGEKFL